MALTTPTKPSNDAKVATPTRPVKRRQFEATYLGFLVPALICFTITITLPAAMGIYFSFTDSVGFGDYNLVGLANYAALFTDPAIIGSYSFTIGFALVTVILTNALAFFLAVGLTAQIRARVALRTIFVMPMVISGIVIAYVFNFLFSNTLPAVGEYLGIGFLKESLLSNPDLAWLSIVIVTAWQAVPSAMLIYIAGLMAIPYDLYEASSLDGASSFGQLKNVTLPLMTGYIGINIIIGFKNFLGAYDIIVGLTNGGPGVQTRSIAMTIFTGFERGDYAYQMANATVFFIISLIIALFQLRLTNKGQAK
ncbi:carbohydrate ABC transporter permease [Glutamicibacter sp. M10]|uniref:carbohydrate ABC transporter permease n=1 Tax=Glutamicibacter sp. M10 TaxID=3023076 RepID=UPI0021C80AF5|nr:sugar ABC transporter permease [Glutamicibacter sp. M10]UXN32591.1 sugar ABC transporter permease [Glutamicibacter sp. M10]